MAEEIIVALFPCTFAEGGECTVPAGSRVVLALGWASKNRGLVQNFLQAQTTTISIDGAAPVDISDSYSAIGPFPDGGFATRIRHDTGVTLSAGESLQVDGMLAVSHVVPDGVIDETTNRQAFFRPEEPLSIHCRITAST
jgi:hypothetical protein